MRAPRIDLRAVLKAGPGVRVKPSGQAAWPALSRRLHAGTTGGCGHWGVASTVVGGFCKGAGL